MLTVRFTGFLHRNLRACAVLVLGVFAIAGSVQAQAPVITSATSATATVGQPFSYQIAATNSPFSFSATGLPSGLSVNLLSGLITGSPTSAGTLTATIGASNASGVGATQFSIAVIPYVAGKITKIGLPPKLGRYFGVGKLNDGRLIIGGGEYNDPQTGSSILTDVFALDTSAATWALHSNLTTGRGLFTFIALDGARILTSSSYFGSGSEVFDGMGWRILTPGPSGSQGGQVLARLTNGKILFAGKESADTWLFDPTTDVWSQAGSLPNSVYEPAVVGLAGNRALLVGGFNGQGTLKSASAFDATTGQWTAVADMAFTRLEPSAVVLDDGRVLVSGDRYSGNSATWEIYIPTSNVWMPFLTGSPSPGATQSGGSQLARLPNGNIIGPSRIFRLAQTDTVSLPVATAGTYPFVIGSTKVAWLPEGVIWDIVPAAQSQTTVVATGAGVDVLVEVQSLDSSLVWTVGQPANGSLTGTAPNLHYTPARGFRGTDTAVVRADSTLFGVTGTTATLTFDCSATAYEPIITTQPLSQTVIAGNSVTLVAAADGPPTPTFQWRKNGVPIGGATGASLTFPSIAGADAGIYTVIATNSVGSVTSNVATLVVNLPPAVTAISAPRQVVSIGQNLTLSATVTGNPAPTYQWKRNGRPVSSATAANFTITSALPSRDAGFYQVVATNSVGSTTSAVVFVNVAVNPAQIVAWGLNTDGQTIVPAGLDGVVTLAAGNAHSVAIKADGTLAAWGNNSYGQCAAPAGLSNVVAIATGHSHTLALRSDGTVAAWGNNDAGQSTVPAGLSNVVALAGGGSHSLALRADGTVIGWGLNTDGQVSVPSGVTNVVGIAAGYYHTVVVKLDGTVSAWGRNDFGQTTIPGGLSNVVSVSTGASHVVALKTDGTVVAWGRNEYGQTTLPVGLASVVSLSAGHNFGIALKADGTVVGWGDNSLGQITLPAGLTRVVGIAGGIYHSVALRDTFGSPAITAHPANQTATAGQSVTFTAAAAGTPTPTYQWRKDGADLSGATGSSYNIENAQSTHAGSYTVVATNGVGSATSNPATLVVNVPPAITAISGPRQVVALGQNLTLSATVTSGTAVSYQWKRNGLPLSGATSAAYTIAAATPPRDNGWYQIVVSNAAGATTSSVIFVGVVVGPAHVYGTGANGNGQTVAPPGLASLLAVAAGNSFSLALKSDGTVLGWGINHLGQSTIPSGLSGVVALAAGLDHSLALRSDGTVVGWGDNLNSQLNISAGLSGVVAIAAGSYHSLALKSDGTVVAWGYSGSAQSTVPAGLSGVIAVAAGQDHSLALKSDGSVVAWGSNSSGQTAVPVGLTGVVAISAKFEHSLALKNDGTVTGWGSNSYGETTVPAGLNGVIAVAVGAYNSVALSSAGTAMAWGLNVLGQTSIPTGLRRIEAIAAGNSHTLFLRNAAEDAAPVVVTSPSSRAANLGEATTFTVAADFGTSPTTFQWRKEATAIPGATAASFTIGVVAGGSAGSYDVVVANYLGTVTSTVAILTINVPPTITSQPSGATVQAGLGASFSVTPAGTAPFAYQWRRNNTAISGATDATFSIGATQTGDAGDYTVVVSNIAGSVTSAVATLAITVPSAITNQPSAVTVLAGQTATFTVEASGLPAPTIQWQRQPAGTTGFVALTNSGAYSGVTASTLSVTPATGVMRGDQFRAVATNGIGNVATSNAATLTVNVPPAFTTQPLGQTVTAGASLSLVAAASGAPAPTFQWKKSGVEILGATNTSLVFGVAQIGDAGIYEVIATNAVGSATSSPALVVVNYAPTVSSQPSPSTVNQGQTATFSVTATGNPTPSFQWRKGGVTIGGNTSATTSVLTVANAQPADAGTYDVVVSNSVGSVTTAGVGLTVNVAPSFTSQPNSETVVVGGSVTLTATASGSPAPAYQWRRNSANIAGATSSSYVIIAVTAVNGGTYDVVASNAAGSASSNPVILTVNVPPGITSQPQNIAVTAGQSATFSVVATGSPVPTYQWRKDGATLSAATNASLTVSGTQPGDAGSYDVIVTNVVGSLTSTSATLTVNIPPAIAQHPVGITVVAGQLANFTVVGTGSPAPTYQWRKGGSVLAGATNAALAIANVQPADAGSYDVIVSNPAGAIISGAAVLTVHVPAAITAQPTNLVVVIGGPGVFTVGATGTPAPTFQWRKAGTVIEGATGSTLTLPSVKATDGDSYDVIVSNIAGSVTSNAVTLVVHIPPAIVTQPTSVSVITGSPASFTTVVTGTPTPTFQWRKEGVVISGATAATLTFPIARPADEGNYDAVVTNAAGAVTTSTVTLTVNVPPAIVTQPVDIVAISGQPASFTVVATGTPTPTFQWRKNSTPLVGATAASFVLASATPAAAGNYDVVITNVAGTATSEIAVLAVHVPPEITVQPTSLIVLTGELASFTVVATGLPAPVYQWRRGGIAIDGATSATLSMTSAQPADAGSYDVIASNAAGTATSVVVTLTVNTPPAITTQPVGVAVVTGQRAAFAVVATGSPTPTFQWRKDGVNISGATQATLSFAAVITADAGGYDVIVSNAARTVTSNAAVLTVNVPPAIAVQPASTGAGVSTSVVLRVVATGTAPFSYQWMKNGVAVSGATSAELTLEALTFAATGVYRVTVANIAGTILSDSAVLTVVDAIPTHAVVGPGYVTGGTVIVTNTVSFGNLTSGLGWHVLLPTGWSFAEGGGNQGDVKPSAGTTDLVEWAWTTIPASPITFTYTLNVPMGTTGNQVLAALAIVRQLGVAASIVARPDPLTVEQVTTHSADVDKDYRLNLVELTRVIELYNSRNGTIRTGRYAVATAPTEDGFAPVQGPAITSPLALEHYHSADSNKNATISLVELTRVIELFNVRAGSARTGAYHALSGTEDGFAPGP